VVAATKRLPGSSWNFGLGWASSVRLCDGFGVVEGGGLEGGGEGGELAVAFDPSVLLFGGEDAGCGPAEAHVGGSFAV
jgi:hypothetical protein